MNTPTDALAVSRRTFLEQAAIGSLVLGSAAGGEPVSTPVAAFPLEKLTARLWVYRGPINIGIVRDGRRLLLIDCGDGSVAARLREWDDARVEAVLFTHHHRDQACGAAELAASGARIIVPQAERGLFDDVAAYWNNPKTRWRLYNVHPHHLTLTESVRVDDTCADGKEISWGPARIRAMATPGHTDGALSYLVEVDGQRVVFCGDAIYDEGRVWEIYSLQKGTQTTDYHGFLGARPQLVESLGRLKDARPDALVPAHGRIMTDPVKAIDALVTRLDRCYDKYVAISALRHYFPKMFAAYAGRADHMPIGPGMPVPDCLRHFGTSWVLVAKDKAALVMDCGNAGIVRKLEELVSQGEIRAVEGLWVTHYHDDHVDGIPAFQKAFTCQCLTDKSVAEVIAEPLAWRLPCISPERARVDRVPRDGESWEWHEFKLTAYHLPGQTLYHAGLLAEGGGLRMLFVGDSFTMAGIDDYCAGNRNWLGSGVGFDRCIALIEKLQPTHIFNCHVNEAFAFTADQCRFMRANLAERERLFGDLVPWDHANYGMDESWVRCHPYEQRAAAGGAVSVDLVVTNHSSGPQTAAGRLVLPRSWRQPAVRSSASADQPPAAWVTTDIRPKSEGRMRLTFRIPNSAKTGRHAIAIDVRYGPWTLPQFSEAIVVID